MKIKLINLGITAAIVGIIGVSGCSKKSGDPVNNAEKTVETSKPVPKKVAETPKPAPVTPTQAQTSAPTKVATLTPEQAGAKLFKRCQACHTLDEGGKNKVGPNLWGVYGRKIGTVEGFKYSKTMLESDIIWSDETLGAYIENPKKYLPGNKMAFAGLRKEQDRTNLLAYLKANTSNN